MANPTPDRLSALPGSPSWQNDADGNDTNQPQDSDSMLHTDATALAGTLRAIKSEVRELSIDPAWIRYTGLLSTPSTGVPTKLSDRKFSLVGDWETPGLVRVGQRVRAVFSNSTAQPVATITDVSVTDGVTTVELNDDILTAVLAQVEFSAVGSWTDGTGHSPIQLVISGDELVVPTQSGGTGSTEAEFSGDLVGPYPSPRVTALQAGVHPISATAPATGETDTDQVFSYDVPSAQWVARTLRTVLGLLVNEEIFQLDMSRGTVVLPVGGGDGAKVLKLKWVTADLTLDATAVGSASPAIRWDSPWEEVLHGVWVIAGSRDALFSWEELNASVDVLARDKTFLDLNFRRFDTPSAPITVRVVVLGIGR